MLPSASLLIPRRFLGMVDNENLHASLLRFQLQPELLLDGDQKRRAAGIWLIGGREVCGTRRECACVRKPLQINVVLSTEIGFIEDHPFRECRKVGNQLCYGHLLAVELANPGMHAETATRRRGRRTQLYDNRIRMRPTISLRFVQFSSFGYD